METSESLWVISFPCCLQSHPWGSRDRGLRREGVYEVLATYLAAHNEACEGEQGDSKTKNLTETDRDLSEWITVSNIDRLKRVEKRYRWFTANDHWGWDWQIISSEEKSLSQQPSTLTNRELSKKMCFDIWELSTFIFPNYNIKVDFLIHPHFVCTVYHKYTLCMHNTQFVIFSSIILIIVHVNILHKTAKPGYILYYLKFKPLYFQGAQCSSKLLKQSFNISGNTHILFFLFF